MTSTKNLEGSEMRARPLFELVCRHSRLTRIRRRDDHPSLAVDPCQRSAAGLPCRRRRVAGCRLLLDSTQVKQRSALCFGYASQSP